MKIPDVSNSPERLYEHYGLYHLSRLRADAELVDLVAPFAERQEALKAHIEEAQVARSESMMTLAIRDAADDGLDDTVREFYLEVLRVVVNNRQDPRYQHYFPDGLTPIIRQPYEDEVRDIGILLTKLEAETDPALKDYAVKIQDAVARLSRAIDEYRTKQDAERLTSQRVIEEKLRWLDAYKRNHKELERRFYKDSKKASRYFRSAKKRARAEDAEEAEGIQDEAEVVVGAPGEEIDD